MLPGVPVQSVTRGPGRTDLGMTLLDLGMTLLDPGMTLLDPGMTLLDGTDRAQG